MQIINSLRRVYTNMVIPGRVIIVDNSCTKTPSGVDASASDWDRGQVNNEHSKSNGEWCQNLQFQDRKQCVNKNQFDNIIHSHLWLRNSPSLRTQTIYNCNFLIVPNSLPVKQNKNKNNLLQYWNHTIKVTLKIGIRCSLYQKAYKK